MDYHGFVKIYLASFIIVNRYPKSNHGIVRLIEVQKYLKHFEWEDEFYEDYYTGDSYKEIFLALEKKADSLNHLRISFGYIEGYENSLLQNILSKL
jgi:hypothetical protein